jgi:hypothetical protein
VVGQSAAHELVLGLLDSYKIVDWTCPPSRSARSVGSEPGLCIVDAGIFDSRRIESTTHRMPTNTRREKRIAGCTAQDLHAGILSQVHGEHWQQGHEGGRLRKEPERRG